MGFQKIEIQGLRGFDVKQKLELAIPDGKEGSGLTVIVGPNNSGKSTIAEAFKVMSQNNHQSFAIGRRNAKAGDKIEITITSESGTSFTLKTIDAGGSETRFHNNGLDHNDVNCLVLRSRRNFDPFFGKDEMDRKRYTYAYDLPALRGSSIPGFTARLFKAQENKGKFDEAMRKVLDEVPSWRIEQNDKGEHFMQFSFSGSNHNSEGAGEGLLSLFVIIDALYDIEVKDMVLIDEPELSLHPKLQRKLLRLFLEYSKTRQLVICTHSPFFISWIAVKNGGKIARTVREEGGSRIYQMKDSTKDQILPLLNNLHNPHILGLDASEVFFLDDKVILVEGQEDVVYYNRILELNGAKLEGSFYGWGVGGAGNIERILNMLKDLGFMKVAVVLDNDKKSMISELERAFPDYEVTIIPTDDVRDKKETGSMAAKRGLISDDGRVIKSEFAADVDDLFNRINIYMVG